MAKSKEQRSNTGDRIRLAAETGLTLLCACNGKPCKGICRETNLIRKRTDESCCPSAYRPAPKRRERRQREDD